MELSKLAIANRRKNKVAKGISSRPKANIPPAFDLQDDSKHIPLGKQLERTPPMSRMKGCVRVSTENQNIDMLSITKSEAEWVVKEQIQCIKKQNVDSPGQVQSPEVGLNVTKDLFTLENTPETTEGGACREYRISSDTVCLANVLDDDPDSLIRSMPGYQWTAEDLEFIKRSKKEKQVKCIEEQLFKLLRLLRNEIHAKDLSLASRKKIQAELDKTMSCEQTLHLGRVFLSRTQSTAEVEDLDSKSLLAHINAADVQYAIQEEQAKFTELKARVARAQEFRDEEERHLTENQNMETKININRLMRELSELKSKLAETKEVHQAIQTKVKAVKCPKTAKKEELVNSQDTLQVASSQDKVPKMTKKTELNGGETNPQALQAPQRKVNTGPKTTEKEDVNSQKALRVAPSRAKTPKVPKKKKTDGESSSQKALQASNARVKSAKVPITTVKIEEVDTVNALRRSKRIAAKKEGCDDIQPVLMKTRTAKSK